MKKLLFISTDLPSKLGGVRRLYYNLQYFSKKFEVHLIRVKLDDSYSKAQLGVPNGVKLKEIPVTGLFFDPACFLFPLRFVRLMRLESVVHQVQRYVDENKIDVVIAFAQECTFAFRNLRVPYKVGEALDSHSRYYLTKKEAEPSFKSQLLGTILPFLYSLAEHMYACSYNFIIYVSEIDAHMSAIPREKIFVSYDVRDPPILEQNLRDRKYDIAIVGRWTHPPNRDGLLRMRQELGKITGSVLIIGPGLPANFSWPANVQVAGFVDDVAKTLSASKICLIPVWYGGGMQNKVFDSLRYGCKVISTSFTRNQLVANGFSNHSLSYSDDLIAAANRAILAWSQKDAAKSYAAYKKFQKRTEEREFQYVSKVEKLSSQ